MNLPEPLPPAEQAHCRRTAALSEMLAKLAGLPDSEVRTVTQSALVHDIGKTAIPTTILCKPGPLTDEERALIRIHTTVGAHIRASNAAYSLLSPEDKKYLHTSQSAAAQAYQCEKRKLQDQKYTALARLCQKSQK